MRSPNPMLTIDPHPLLDARAFVTSFPRPLGEMPSPAALQAKSANAQAELARRAHVTELFNRAVGQLRDPNLEVRLAAIYVLREVAKDFPRSFESRFRASSSVLKSG